VPGRFGRAGSKGPGSKSEVTRRQYVSEEEEGHGFGRRRIREYQIAEREELG